MVKLGMTNWDLQSNCLPHGSEFCIATHTEKSVLGPSAILGTAGAVTALLNMSATGTGQIWALAVGYVNVDERYFCRYFNTCFVHFSSEILTQVYVIAIRQPKILDNWLAGVAHISFNS